MDHYELKIVADYNQHIHTIYANMLKDYSNGFVSFFFGWLVSWLIEQNKRR